MEEGIVYKWTNNINKKWYIGSHKGSVGDKYTASGVAIKRAFKKYGINSFSREIIYEGPDYREVEELVLKTLKASTSANSYNLKDDAIGGSGPRTAESNKKTSDTLLKMGHKPPDRTGSLNSEVHRSKISKALTGRNHSESTKTKIGDSNRGKKKPLRTEEHRQNISTAHTGMKLSPETLAKRYVSRYLKEKTKEEQEIMILQKIQEYSK
jgi:group I intron endonuclease